MAPVITLDPYHPTSVLAYLQFLITSPEAENFERFWRSCKKTIESHIKNPAFKEQILGALERYLVEAGPARGVYGADIANADPVKLRILDCVYDAWSLLVKHGRTPRIRGPKTAPWETHEKPMIESYLWEVKARLARSWKEKSELFDAAKEAASAGNTNHSYNRRRHLEAHSLRYQAESRIRGERYSEAAAIFARARELATGTNLESLVGFREALCTLIDAELRLDFESALKAHEGAVEFMESLPNPSRLFVRANPWTSPQDFKNEQLFIQLLSALRANGTESLDLAISNLATMLQATAIGIRQLHLQVLRLFLQGLKAASEGSRVPLEDRLSQISENVHGPHALRQWSQLYDNLQRLRLSNGAASDVLDVLQQVIPFFPYHASGSGSLAVPPLLHGAPSWLQKLRDSVEPGARRLMLIWYVRLLLDYASSIHEKNAGEDGRAPMSRPRFAGMSLAELRTAALNLSAALKWEDQPGRALDLLIEELQKFALEEGVDEGKLEEDIRLFLRNTDLLFPLVLRSKWLRSADWVPADRVVLRRTDGNAGAYEYSAAEIDPRTREGSVGEYVYVKARYRRTLHAPRDRENRPLYLYPAPACPEFSCACMIVEGASDVAFFETLLDRVQPGWRALRCESHPMRAAIEVRRAGGAPAIPWMYERTKGEGFFHSSNPTLDAGSERIVLVLDEDHSGLLTKQKLDISRARHRVVLHPDLERVAPQALIAALGSFLKRPLRLDERTLLTEFMALSAHEFEQRVSDKWGVYLKRQKDPRNSVPFAISLAKSFPKPADRQPWNRVWDACDRLLLLAMGSVRVAPLTAL